MDAARLHDHRHRLIVKTSSLIKQRDAEIQRYGAAREGTARKLILADAQVQEIEHELRSQER